MLVVTLLDIADQVVVVVVLVQQDAMPQEAEVAVMVEQDYPLR